jgi:hypothetical protein
MIILGNSVSDKINGSICNKINSSIREKVTDKLNPKTWFIAYRSVQNKIVRSVSILIHDTIV